MTLEAASYNATKATCFICCVDCDGGYEEAWADPDPIDFPIDDSMQAYRNSPDLSGTQYNITGSARWKSDNTAIATVQASGLAAAVAPGTTDIVFYYTVYPTEACGFPDCSPLIVPVSVPMIHLHPYLSITSVQYQQFACMDKIGRSNPSPVAMSQTVWTELASYPSVFVAGNSISATATFNVAPAPATAITGASITGNVAGLGQLMATGVSIPAGASSVTVPLSGNSAFPVSTTQYYPGLGIGWIYSQNGQTCSSESAYCQSAGSTSSPVYVTLASPSGLSESVMPLTAVKLAIGSGGATTQTAAWQNTWQKFAGPGNVTGWDGRVLYYYEQGVPFSGCATNSVGLLTQSNGSGQCGSWARLLMDALAVNGISSSWTTVTPNAANEMLVKTWAFSAPPTYPTMRPGNTGLRPTLRAEAMEWYRCRQTPSSAISPAPPGFQVKIARHPPQKFFGRHFIVKAPSGLGVGGPYFDPSYGVTYSNACSFESTAIAGYANLIGGTNNFYVEKPSGACSVTLVP